MAALCCQIPATAHSGNPSSPPLSSLKFSSSGALLLVTLSWWYAAMATSLHIFLSPQCNSLNFPHPPAPPNLQVFFLC
ncbi:hypothetical protein GYH30_009004 [Glycine max]|nr:hypothetical protein GYH30_009004 [Glycine max]